jgi:uncharacterized protein (UPF0147 family)
MIEKIRPINNPLTIIAIFAALSEIASTIALKLISPELQSIFIWFVMGFPAVIVIAFFLILIFKREILYGPGDFKDEEHFVKLIRSARSYVVLRSEQATKQLEEATEQIIKVVEDKKEPEDIRKAVDESLAPVKENINNVKETANWFSLSHELAHYVLHNPISEEAIASWFEKFKNEKLAELKSNPEQIDSEQDSENLIPKRRIRKKATEPNKNNS